jgi:hypothetical protein
MTTKAGKEVCKANNPYGRRGKPGGPRSGGDLRARKAVEGISEDMYVVVDEDRYWKNVRYLEARYREITRTVGQAFRSMYPTNGMF